MIVPQTALPQMVPEPSETMMRCFTFPPTLPPNDDALESSVIVPQSALPQMVPEPSDTMMRCFSFPPTLPPNDDALEKLRDRAADRSAAVPEPSDDALEKLRDRAATV